MNVQVFHGTFYSVALFINPKLIINFFKSYPIFPAHFSTYVYYGNCFFFFFIFIFVLLEDKSKLKRKKIEIQNKNSIH